MLRVALKNLLLALLVFLFFLVLTYTKLVLYGLSQLKGQLEIVWGAEPIEQVLQRPELDDTTRNKLSVVSQLLRFAQDSLGMETGRAYRNYYSTGGREVLWVLTAAEPFRLEAYYWYFPFLGRVSYKGFFSYDDAVYEQKELDRQGWDTDLSPVRAWSTLGVFNDPILSPMLRRSEGRLSELIFHELTHRNLYRRDETEWNENVATYFGEQAARCFLKSHFSNRAELLTNYEEHLADEEIYSAFMLKAAASLDSFYSKLNPELDFQVKKKLKHAQLDSLSIRIQQLPLGQNKNTKRLLEPMALNNTDFLAWLRYRRRQADWHIPGGTAGELRQSLDSLQKKYGKSPFFL